jgi:hypothetical protein
MDFFKESENSNINSTVLMAESQEQTRFTTTDHQALFWAWDLSRHSQEDSYAWRRVFSGQDEIDKKRGRIIGKIEEDLKVDVSQNSLFILRWIPSSGVCHE